MSREVVEEQRAECTRRIAVEGTKGAAYFGAVAGATALYLDKIGKGVPQLAQWYRHAGTTTRVLLPLAAVIAGFAIDGEHEMIHCSREMNARNFAKPQ